MTWRDDDGVLRPGRRRMVKDIAWLRDRVVEDENGCHIWQRSTCSGGYGWYRDGRGLPPRRAHRLSLALSLGVDYDELDQANHLCDVRKCCNPDHLYNGTQADNVRDMFERGRNHIRKVAT